MLYSLAVVAVAECVCAHIRQVGSADCVFSMTFSASGAVGIPHAVLHVFYCISEGETFTETPRSYIGRYSFC